MNRDDMLVQVVEVRHGPETVSASSVRGWGDVAQTLG